MTKHKVEKKEEVKEKKVEKIAPAIDSHGDKQVVSEDSHGG